MPSILTRPIGGGGAGGSISVALSDSTPDYGDDDHYRNNYGVHRSYNLYVLR